MKLTETPKTILWPVTHFVFVEKGGPFNQTARAAWEELYGSLPELSSKMTITKRLSLFRTKPQPLYRAGVAVTSKPESLPAGLQYLEFQGGKYACFDLRGSYLHLPEAYTRVFKIVTESQMKLRDGFHLEHYTNDPSSTPEEQWHTEILIPVE